MKLIRKKLRPSRAVGTHHQRPALRGALIESERVPVREFPRSKVKLEEHLVLYCTNGYVFIRVDLGKKEPMDEPGPIPVEALRHIEAGVNANLGLDFVQIGLTRYERTLADAPYADTTAKAFPKFEKTMDQFWKEPQGSNVMTINVNPKLLLDAAKAIGSEDEIELVLDKRSFKEVNDKVMTDKERRQKEGKRRVYYSKAMKIQPRTAVKNNKAYGFVMPMSPNTDELRDDE